VIRPASQRDARALSALVRKNADDLLAGSYSARQLAAWKRYNTPARIRRRIAERATFCAFRGRRLCATAALGGTEVQGLYVNPRVCGQGIGRRLLSHLESLAASQGVTSLHLTSTPGAVAFYVRNGWRAGRTVVVVVLGVQFEETHMTKRLDRGRRSKSP
jgi:GNAT superfamily N-acetyltransferase